MISHKEGNSSQKFSKVRCNDEKTVVYLDFQPFADKYFNGKIYFENDETSKSNESNYTLSYEDDDEDDGEEDNINDKEEDEKDDKDDKGNKSTNETNESDSEETDNHLCYQDSASSEMDDLVMESRL